MAAPAGVLGDTPKSGLYVDATLGGGGHSRTIAQHLTDAARLICLDCDQQAIDRNQQWIDKHARSAQIEAHHINFVDMSQAVASRSATGILMDLGLSSIQLEQRGRGFSFSDDGSCDMRLDAASEGSLTALDILHDYSEKQLADLLFGIGNERKARPIARAIKKELVHRPEMSSKELATLIVRVVGTPKPGAIHPATRTFLSLRIEVNDELEVLKKGMSAAVEALAPNGHLVVISFQSLEDRIVKHFFRSQELQLQGEELMGPWRCSEQERKENNRSRSAVMRVWSKNK